MKTLPVFTVFAGVQDHELDRVFVGDSHGLADALEEVCGLLLHHAGSRKSSEKRFLLLRGKMHYLAQRTSAIETVGAVFGALAENISQLVLAQTTSAGKYLNMDVSFMRRKFIHKDLKEDAR